MIQELFGNRVKEIRIEKGLSQDYLALASGIDRPQISKIEQGKINVTLDTMARLAKALDIKVANLLETKVKNKE